MGGFGRSAIKDKQGVWALRHYRIRERSAIQTKSVLSGAPLCGCLISKSYSLAVLFNPWTVPMLTQTDLEHVSQATYVHGIAGRSAKGAKTCNEMHSGLLRLKLYL